jgi:hypothetical protein
VIGPELDEAIPMPPLSARGVMQGPSSWSGEKIELAELNGKVEKPVRSRLRLLARGG